MLRLFSLFVLSLVVSLMASAAVTLGFPGEEAASVGIYVKDLRSGKVIASNDCQKALVPASIMKALTAASALTSLPDDFRFDTKIFVSGPISSDGVCAGNLIIESCADPTIDSELFEDKTDRLSDEIAGALARFGIKGIKGKILIRQRLIDDGCIPQWQIDDVAWAYGAGLYGFNFADNVFKIWPKKGTTQPRIPDLNIQVRQAESSDMVRGINSSTLIVYGPRSSSDKWMMRSAMQNPAGVYAILLKANLSKRGITIEDEDVANSADAKLIFTHHSPPLADILREMMYESHNLFAEGMLRALLPDGNRKNAIKKVVNLWSSRGVSTAYLRMLDGSGLARADRLQPIFLAGVLEWMAKSEYAASYTALFPKVGIDGTVKSLLQKSTLKGRLALKSGSVNGVQCFAGYKIDGKGRPTHVVVIQVNDFFCERAAVRKAIEKFLTDTFK